MLAVLDDCRRRVSKLTATMSLFTSVTGLSYGAKVAGIFRVGRKLSLLRWLGILFGSQTSSNSSPARWWRLVARLLFDAIGQCIS